MQDSAERVKQAAQGHEDARIDELTRYHSLSDEDLEDTLDEATMYLHEVATPAQVSAEQDLHDMEALHSVALAITPDMEDELHEARLRWEGTRCQYERAVDIVADLEQVAFAREQAWEVERCT